MENIEENMHVDVGDERVNSYFKIPVGGPAGI